MEADSSIHTTALSDWVWAQIGGCLTGNEKQQLAFEEELQRTSVYQYAQKVADLREAGQEDVTRPTIHALQAHIGPVAEGLSKYMDDALKKPGVKAVAYRKLVGMDPNVAALLALRSVLCSIHKPRRIQTVAVRIGREIEDELRFASYEKTNPGLYHTVQKGINESPHAYRRHYHRSVLVHTANKFKVEWEEWSEADRNHVGTFLIHVMLEYTKLIQLRKYRNPRGPGIRIDVAGTTELLEWLDAQHDRIAELSPKRLPMFCEPRDWVSLEEGGYLTPYMQRDMVRVRQRGHREMFSPENMPEVYNAINYYQKVRYRVDTRVLDVARRLWDTDHLLPKAAWRTEIPLPRKPHENEGVAARKQYKMEARKVHYRNRRNDARRLIAIQTMSIAQRMRGHTIWFPYHLDFRGRLYASTQFLTPQGADLSKGLIRFDEGKELGEGGAWWLAVHVANTYGEDKLSLQDRVDWTVEMSDWVADIARDPIGNRDWHDADKPFQFLQACFEWLGYVEEGESYKSSIAIEIDGSCNGIQHLAGMSLDKEAGLLVNLVPGEAPGDIYSKVAARTVELLESIKARDPDEIVNKVYDKLVDETPERFVLIDGWLRHGVSRSVCKRPTMILPYNGSLSSACKYIADYMLDEEESTGKSFFGEDTNAACNLLGRVMWAAMSEVVSGPRKTMDWVGSVVREANKTDMPVIWTGPSGFPVIVSYPKMNRFEVSTRVGDQAYRHVLTVADEIEIDKNRQVRSSAPHLVHANDAGMLHKVGLFMQDHGVNAMRVVHDGFGTYAGDTPLLVCALQQGFVDLYGEGDTREEFADEVAAYCGLDRHTLPPAPPRGDLDITGIFEADYFFA